MARLLVRLKLRILTNALHASGRARVSFVISTLFAVLVAIGTFVLLAEQRGATAPVDMTALVFTVFAFGWLIVPLLAFGLDSTLDPATLALYPLRTRPLAIGLLAASATGAWPLANVIGLLGVTIGLAHGLLGVVVALVAVVLQVLFCITLARFVTTALAGLLRSRRGKDFAVLLVIPIFALYEAFAQVVPRLAAEGKITSGTFAGIDRWLRWLPPGLAAHAIQAASAGRAGGALWRLALLAAVIVVLGALWIRSLRRSLVAVDTSTQSSAVRGSSLPFARSGIRGTVAGRYLLYQRREPGSLVRWGIIAVVMIGLSVSTIRTPSYHVALILSAVLGSGIMGSMNANAIGSMGPGFGLEATALSGTRSLRAYFDGRNIALAAIAVPLFGLVSLGLSAFAGHSSAWFWAVAIDLAAIGASLGFSSIYSAALAFPVVRRVGSPMPATADGYGGQAGAASLGSLIGVVVGSIPVIVAAELTLSAPAAIRDPVILVCAAGYGLFLAWGGARVAAAVAQQKLPDLYQVAVRSTV